MGSERTNPKFTPEAVNMMLFGPGVNAITKANEVAAINVSCVIQGPIFFLNG
jgi:hypothetical protein